MSTSGIMEREQMGSEAIPAWLMSSINDRQYRTSLLQLQNRDHLINSLSNCPPNANQTNLPFTNGIGRIKSEPVDADTHQLSQFNGNARHFGRKRPTNFLHFPPNPKTRPIAAVGDTVAPNVCQICGKWFRSRQQVSQHLLVHTDERRYKCAYCDRAFKQASHLQQHHRIHTGEKPYRCPLPGCTRAFPQLSNLNHHLRNHDKPEPPPSNTCVYCKRVYASETVLRSHMQKIHCNQPATAPSNLSDPTKLEEHEIKTEHKINETMSCDVFKMASHAAMATLTAAPPAINFSQAFLSPFVHDLNYVKMSPNLPGYERISTDSKMTLPISIPNKNGGDSLGNEMSKSRLNETNFGTMSRAEADKESPGNDTIRNSVINGVSQESFEYDLNDYFKSDRSSFINGNRNQKHVSVTGHLNDQLDANNEVEMFSGKGADVNQSDSECDPSCEQDGEKEIGKSAVQYSYTLESVDEESNGNLVIKHGRKQADQTLNEFKRASRLVEPENPWAASDEILQSNVRSTRHHHKDNVRLEEYINQIDRIIRSRPSCSQVDVMAINRTLQLPCHGNFNEQKALRSNDDAFVKGNMDDIKDSWGSSEHILRSKINPQHSGQNDMPMTTNGEFRMAAMKGETPFNKEENGDILTDNGIRSQPDTDVGEPWTSLPPSCDGLVSYPKDFVCGISNGDNFSRNTEELQSHSRKRKAFRPQRVVHEKVFVQDADL